MAKKDINLENVVVLSINEYDKLKELHYSLAKVNEKNKLTFAYDPLHDRYRIWYSADKALKQAEEYNKELLKKLNALTEEYEAMKKFYNDSKTISEQDIKNKVMREIKQISIWRFIKLKRNDD